MYELQTVFRVEDDEGAGPYRGKSSEECDSPLRDHWSSNGRPPPADDYDHRDFYFNLGGMIDSYLFGFTDITQLKQWFDEMDLAYLAAKGYVVREYQTTMMRPGSHQIMFHKEYSNVINTHNITEI